LFTHVRRRFLTISERVRRNKGWVMTEFPDLPDAVAASKEVAKWDPRQQNLDPESRQRFYKGILAKVGLHASGSMVGLPWRKLVAPSAADPGASRFDIQGRVTRMFFYGHVFLPRWEDGRHFKTKEELLAKVPSVIAFVKDPVSRMQSAYNYVRVGARSEEHRKEVRRAKLGERSWASEAGRAKRAKRAVRWLRKNGKEW